ncbi:unnamed protein product [Sphacelaria rigidula]
MFSGLAGSKYFPSVDLASGFFQSEVAKENRLLTAFRDSKGTTPTFHRTVSVVLLRARGVKNWLDDILWSSATFASHMTGLRVVLHCLLTTELTVNFLKSQWCTQQQDFVGMAIDAPGIRPSQSKIEAITHLREPQRVDESRSFLRLTGYLRQYVRGYSNISPPLTGVLRDKRFATRRAQGMTIPWGPQQRQAFVDLKGALMSYPILVYPDWDGQFVLHSDASEYTAGAALAQEAGEREWIIEDAIVIDGLDRAGEDRSATERDVVAVSWSVERLRSYLWG